MKNNIIYNFANFIEEAGKIGVKIIAPNFGNEPTKVPLLIDEKEFKEDGWYVLVQKDKRIYGYIANMLTGMTKMFIGDCEGIVDDDDPTLGEIEKEILAGYKSFAEAELAEYGRRCSHRTKYLFDTLPRHCGEKNRLLRSYKLKAKGNIRFTHNYKIIVQPIFTDITKPSIDTNAGGVLIDRYRSRTIHGSVINKNFFIIPGNDTLGYVLVTHGYINALILSEMSGATVYDALIKDNIESLYDRLKSEIADDVVVVVDDGEGIDIDNIISASYESKAGITHLWSNMAFYRNWLKREITNVLRFSGHRVVEKDDVEEYRGNMTTELPDNIISDCPIIEQALDALHHTGGVTTLQYVFPAVMSLVSTIIGPSVHYSGIYCNLYNVKVGKSSSGKSEIDKQLLGMMNKYSKVKVPILTDFASGAGLLRIFADSEGVSKLLNIDECLTLFGGAINSNNANEADKAKVLLELYSAGGTTRVKVFANKKDNVEFTNPFLSITGNTTFSLFEALTSTDLDSGLLNRFDFFCYDNKLQYRNDCGNDVNAGAKQVRTFVRSIEKLSTITPGDLKLTQDTYEKLDWLSRSIIDSLNSVDKTAPEAGVIARRYEVSVKYMIIHAMCKFAVGKALVNGHIIDMDSLEFGCKVADAVVSWKKNTLLPRMVHGSFDASTVALVDAILLAVDRGIKPTMKNIAKLKAVIRNWTPEYFDSVINASVRRDIVYVDSSGVEDMFYLIKKDAT